MKFQTNIDFEIKYLKDLLTFFLVAMFKFLVWMTLTSSLSMGINHDRKGRIKMGEPNHNCDDAEWPNNYIDIGCNDFICSGPTVKGARKHTVKLDLSQPDYGAMHMCMNKKIVYNRTIPSSGDHRPLWAKYGEYAYCPPQRWLHNAEHGGIIFLYNPCLESSQIKLLRKAVKKAKVKKYVMTPYSLPRDMPIAVVAWRSVLQMNAVDVKQIVKFSKKRYNKGPESTNKEGQYTFGYRKSLDSYIADLNQIFGIEFC
ncbi:uncharacterized protein [Mytilus edulis]|uniref:uncharacterized protein isoform X2 n=1 Tax=Mytilus edulis TaxID=6550 RepID=UPI0039EEDE0C